MKYVCNNCGSEVGRLRHKNEFLGPSGCAHAWVGVHDCPTCGEVGISKVKAVADNAEEQKHIDEVDAWKAKVINHFAKHARDGVLRISPKNFDALLAEL